jgi:hypothetical protein
VSEHADWRNAAMSLVCQGPKPCCQQLHRFLQRVGICYDDKSKQKREALLRQRRLVQRFYRVCNSVAQASMLIQHLQKSLLCAANVLVMHCVSGSRYLTYQCLNEAWIQLSDGSRN